MGPESGPSLATPLIKIFLLIFAGFAAMLLRIYDMDAEEMDSGSTEVLAWFFMSVSIVPIYAAFLLSLVLLTDEGGIIIEYIAYLLGVFITIPTLVLATFNLYIGLTGEGDVEFPLYQRIIGVFSAAIIWGTFAVIVISYFCTHLPYSILN